MGNGLPEDLGSNLELQAILANVTVEANVPNMVMEWNTKEGRAKLRRLYGHNEEDDGNGAHLKKRVITSSGELRDDGTDTDTDEESHQARKMRRKQKPTSSAISVDDSCSEDQSCTESPATRARRNAKGVKTRHQIDSIAKKKRQTKNPKTKSVRLPALEDLRRQLKSRRALMKEVVKNSKESSKTECRRPSGSGNEVESPLRLRRSKRNLVRRGASPRSTRTEKGVRGEEKDSDQDDVYDKKPKNLNDTMKQLSDADEEIGIDEEEEIELEEFEESIGSDEAEESEVHMSEADEEDDNEADEDFDSEDLFEDTDVAKKPKSRRKANGRRKRTRPRNIFQAQGDALSAREQQERLDFLVQQSAAIAKDLHVAMATQSGKHSDVKDGSGGGQPDETVVEKQEQAFVPPTGESCALQPHQNEGIKWLLMLDAQGLNAILADEMGLGKTIQAISFLASLVISGSRGPHLVIAPRNVCAHWAEEVEKFYPGQISVVTHLGSADERFENLEQVLKEDAFDIMVTSYELAARDIFSKKRREGFPSYSSLLRAFRNVEFEYLVVDEAHRLKNDNSKINIGIRSYAKAQRRLLLTGTPLSNNLKELWSLMNVLNPQIFSSKATFETWFSAPFSSKMEKKNTNVGLTAAEKSVIVDRLHTVIRPFFRRRVRADVCPTFTSADEVVIRCPMSALQKALMVHFQHRATTKDAGLNNVVMAMRRVCNHPYIVSPALYDSYSNQVSPRVVAVSGKFVFLYYALPRLLAGDHRVLIFSQFREVLDFLEDLMELLHVKFSRLDGMTSADDRSSGLAEFNREGSDIPVFLLTTRAGGVGLNLQTADTVILFDSDWNPSADLQAVSRIQRIGQKKTVHILRLVTDRSIDDLIVEAARNKMKTQAVAVGAGKFNTSHGAALDQRMRQRDLEQLLQRLESMNYKEIDFGDTGITTTDCSVDTSKEERADKLMFRKWDEALLRTGETALPVVSLDPIWIDSVDGCRPSDIPRWLRKDADIWAAAKALYSSGPLVAVQIYEDALKSKALIGSYSKRGRAARARRQVINYEDFSDLGSGDDEKDPELVINDIDFVEEESDVETDNIGPEENEKEKVQMPGAGLLQDWSKSPQIPISTHDVGRIGSNVAACEAPRMNVAGAEVSTTNVTGVLQSGWKTMDTKDVAIVTATKHKTLGTDSNGVFIRPHALDTGRSKPQGIFIAPVSQSTNSSTRFVAGSTRTSSLGTGIPVSKSGQTLNQKNTTSISTDPTHGISRKSVSSVPVKRRNGVAIPRTSPWSQMRQRENTPNSSTVQNQAARYILEYNRLCAAIGVSPVPAGSRRFKSETEVECMRNSSSTFASTGVSSQACSGSAGLPIGLSKMAPPSTTNQTYRLSGLSGQAAQKGSLDLISKTTPVFQKERKMPTALRRTVPQTGCVDPGPSVVVPQPKPPFAKAGLSLRESGQVLGSQTRTVPQVLRKERQSLLEANGLPQKNLELLSREMNLSNDGIRMNSKGSQSSAAQRPRRSVPSGMKALNSISTCPFSTNKQLSGEPRGTRGKSRTRNASFVQSNSVSKAHQESSRRPVIPATEVIVLTDSDDDFEISFSVNTDTERTRQRA
eukprot:gb/GEZJ01000493.1/.p1 GENE.gb/GEZJ01000493.1/~~gb/GEZJ01000493.1/.p1  ORF type:complete len:1665 (-),score=293.33 gb/GEZJ01000493.1/:3404-8185(-)